MRERGEERRKGGEERRRGGEEEGREDREERERKQSGISCSCRAITLIGQRRKERKEGEGEGGVCAHVSLGSEGKELGERLFSEEHESDATNPSIMEDEFLNSKKR